ncbi:MAG: CPBP family intramembrane metalloprotease [Deltaproteobacteria bacterium]|nr:MAG: CPBP family intramembrane metalloprotease [Deltaproteobacteria bacterium]
MPRIERGIRATLGLLAATALLAVVPARIAALPEPLVALSLNALTTAAFFSLLAFAGATLSRTPSSARLGIGRGRLPGPAVALLALGLLSTSQALDTLIAHLGGASDGVLAHVEAALAGARGWRLGLALLAVGIAPAVGEELFFRGLLQRGLTRRVGVGGAIALSALAFGIAHLDRVQGAAALVLGLYLGAVAQLCGGVRAAIACHAVNNLAAVLSAALATGAPHLPLALVPLELLLGAGALALADTRSRLWAPGAPRPDRPDSDRRAAR